MRLSKLLALALLGLFASVANAAGFEGSYQVYQGDFNGDGRIDFYIREVPNIVILNFDVPIPIAQPSAVVPFVLIQNANGTFSISTNLSGLNLSAATKSSVTLRPVDLNLDGNSDAVLTGISAVIPGAYDQIVYSSAQAGPRNVPALVKPLDPGLNAFFKDLNGWFQDSNYFENTALQNHWYTTTLGQAVVAWWNGDYLQAWGYTLPPSGNFLVAPGEDPYNGSVVPASCSQVPCLFNGLQWTFYLKAQPVNVTYDYSHFNANARALAQVLSAPEDAQSLPGGSTAAISVSNILSQVLGTNVMAGVLASQTAKLPWETDTQPDLDIYRMEAIEAVADTMANLNSRPDPTQQPFVQLPNVSVKAKRITQLEQHGQLTAVHGIVLHRTVSSNLSSSLNEARSGIGAHYYIDKDGTIYQAASLDKVTRNVGEIYSKCQNVPSSCSAEDLAKVNSISGLKRISNWEYRKPWPQRYPDNNDTVAIEVVSNCVTNCQKGTTNPVWEAATPQQLASIATLVEALKAKYGLSNTDVYQHQKISPKTPSEAAGLGY
jgi:N-acetyl-anhydromuramyl-L-alanine amidase AmpD